MTEMNTTCMDCGKKCSRFEEVLISNNEELELWCYCPECDCETFHPIED